MENVYDFLSAALPWIAMGLLLAVFFAKRGKEEKETGKAGGIRLRGDAGPGMMAGMVPGLFLGSKIKKKDEGKRYGKTEHF